MRENSDIWMDDVTPVPTWACCSIACACASCGDTTGPFWESPLYWNWRVNTAMKVRLGFCHTAPSCGHAIESHHLGSVVAFCVSLKHLFSTFGLWPYIDVTNSRQPQRLFFFLKNYFFIMFDVKIWKVKVFQCLSFAYYYFLSQLTRFYIISKINIHNNHVEYLHNRYCCVQITYIMYTHISIYIYIF